MKLPRIFLIFFLPVSWEVSVLIMGTWTVDLFKDRQRAGFLICSSHSNPMFCVPSYSFSVSRAAAGCSRARTGLKLKGHTFLFRLCSSMTSGRSTSEIFQLPNQCSADPCMPSWKLRWHSSPWIWISNFHAYTHTHMLKKVEDWGARAPSVLGLTFYQDQVPSGQRWEKKPRLRGMHCLLQQARIFYSQRSRGSILSPVLTAMGEVTSQVEMVRDVLMLRTVV